MGLFAGLTFAAALPAAGDTAEHAPGSQAQTELIVQRFAARFAVIGPQTAADSEALYADDVRFRDPITELVGREAMRRYLEHFGDTARGARFVITDTLIQPGNAAVFWTMTPPARDGEPGRPIEGVSHLRVAARVYEERDYFDLGEVYDQVPVVNWFTGAVKSRLKPAD